MCTLIGRFDFRCIAIICWFKQGFTSIAPVLPVVETESPDAMHHLWNVFRQWLAAIDVNRLSSDGSAVRADEVGYKPGNITRRGDATVWDQGDSGIELYQAACAARIPDWVVCLPSSKSRGSPLTPVAPRQCYPCSDVPPAMCRTT